MTDPLMLAQPMKLWPNVEQRIETNNLAYLDTMLTDQAMFYDARASLYDEQNNIPPRASHRKVQFDFYNTRIADSLPTHMAYLDFGCATGSVTKAYLVTLEKHSAIKRYAIDVSYEMVKLARKNLSDFTVIQGGVERLDFPMSLDLITTFGRVVCHMTPEDLSSFFQNAHRSLKPGGFLCFDAIKQFEVGEHGYTQYDVDEQNRYLAYYSIKQDGSRLLGSDGQPIIGMNRMLTYAEIESYAASNHLYVVAVKELATRKDAKGRYLGLTDLAVILQNHAS